MADNTNTQEELSMEEILSSIKGILSENENDAPTAQASSEPSHSPEPSQTQPSAEDDVYDLSASMIVEQHPAVDTSEPIETVEPVSTEVVSSSPFSESAAEAPASIPEVMPEAPVSLPDSIEVTPIIDEPYQAPSSPKDEAPLSDVDDLPMPEDIKSDSDDVLSLDNLPEVSVDELISSNNASNNDIDDDISDLSALISDDTSADISAADLPYIDGSVKEAEAISQPEVKPVDEVKTVDEVKEEVSEPADVSEAIIDNFAQMFNANKPSASTSAAIAPSSETTLIGADSKTVADLVKEVLRDSLQPVVEQKLQNIDADILQVLHAEIKAQAKAWVDANLNRVVEDAVKEEIKRVIAKVGS